MSGAAVSRALQDRFEDIRRVEFARLKKRLSGLSDEERRAVEAMTAAIIHAIAQVPARALSTDFHDLVLEAVVRLFALEVDTGRSS